MSGNHPSCTDVLFHDHYGERRHSQSQPIGRDRVDAVVQLLLGELEDKQVLDDISGSLGDEAFSNPPLADFAGYVLNQLDSKRFPFTLSASLADRERQRAAVIHTGRSGVPSGQPPPPAR